MIYKFPQNLEPEKLEQILILGRKEQDIQGLAQNY